MPSHSGDIAAGDFDNNGLVQISFSLGEDDNGVATTKAVLGIGHGAHEEFDVELWRA